MPTDSIVIIDTMLERGTGIRWRDKAIKQHRLAIHCVPLEGDDTRGSGLGLLLGGIVDNLPSA